MVHELEETVESFLFGNIRGIMPLNNNKVKLNFLSDCASINNNLIVALTESHLSCNIKDCEVKFGDHDIHRCDRESNNHGGVIIFSKKNSKTTKILEWRNEQCEVVGVFIKSVKTLFFCVYRPPNSGSYDTFSECIDMIQNSINEYGGQCDQYIVCGDFNFPYINWPSGFLKNRVNTKDKDRKQAALLLDFMDINSFSNVISSPTRNDNIIE